MAVNPDAHIEVTGFEWVPEFARGFVRDMRPRWALEEIGLDYRERLIGQERPDGYEQDQPFRQVPVYKEGDLTLFESGAMLIHIGEKDERLLPRDTEGRARAIGWLIAALNSVEPISFQLVDIDVFNEGADWTKERRPAVIEQVDTRLGQVADWLGNREWLENRFTIGDMLIIDALRGVSDDALMAKHPTLQAYVERGTSRPAFKRAMEAQLAAFDRHEPAMA